MSFQALFNARSGLTANRAALDTVAHNIANASTPNYSRQQAILASSPGIDQGVGIVGTGVNVATVKRITDTFLEDQVRQATAKGNSLESIESTYRQVELFFNELSDNDLSSSMNSFWDSMQELVANADDVSARTAVVTQSKTLNSDFKNLIQNLDLIRSDVDSNIDVATENINVLADRIAALNQDIIQAESAGATNKSANDLRDARDKALAELFEITDGFVIEDGSGAVNVTIGGQALVFRNLAFPVTTGLVLENGETVKMPLFSDGSRLEPSAGILHGLLESRDVILPGIQSEIHELAGNIIWEFNKMHASGRGLVGLSSVTSEHAVDNATSDLDATSLGFTPVTGTFAVQNGTFDVIVRNKITGEEERVNIAVDLDNQATLTPATKLADLNVLQGTFRITDTNGNNYDIVVDNTVNNIQDVINAIDNAVDITSNPATQGRLEARIVNNRLEIIDKVAANVVPMAVADVVGTVGNQLFGFADTNGATLSTFEGQDLTAIIPPGNDMDLEALGFILNSVANIDASVNAQRRLTIDSSSSDFEFHFDNDNSDVLAYLGINTYFSGHSASTIGVNEDVENDVRLFSAGNSDSPSDNTNVLEILALRDTDLMSGDAATFEEFYETTVSSLALETLRAVEALTNQELVIQSLEFERDQISGVSLDEEAAKMIQFQRGYQASARMISVIDELLQTIINL